MYPEQPLLTPTHLLQTLVGIVSYSSVPLGLKLALAVPVFNAALGTRDTDVRCMALVGCGVAWYATEGSYVAAYLGGAIGKILWLEYDPLRTEGGNVAKASK